MRATSNLLFSILLSATISFILPMILIGILLGCSLILGILPYGISLLGEQAAAMIFEILAIFGNGKPFAGVITLGITSCIVGILFDLFNFYRYRTFGD
ncbi:MAG: hypothetical protein QNJ18_18460 [Xenococcaceae cyanobacterium MO_167.B52]|nr:hypothetical protein [Xenococcaceae cyanobacterium MO_167.B52]